ncbi:MAG TPA: SGNH/GDSL hydrolase family protein [Thermosynechococcaceae cyanobacterium]
MNKKRFDFNSPLGRVTIVLTLLALALALALITSPSEEVSASGVRIMPLGDSITQGDMIHGSYRRSLWRRLREDGYLVDFVGSTRQQLGGFLPPADFDRDHEGHWGWRVDEILPRIEQWSQQARPDIVLIHLGTNDLASRQSIESTVGELQSLIQILRRVNPRVKVLIAQIIPLWGSEAQFQTFNAQIGQMAQQLTTENAPVIAVDQFSGFDPISGKDTYDGCHPNASGEAKMVDRWFAALQKVLPRAGHASRLPPRYIAPGR